MFVADRLRSVREEKELSQGDIEKRTGLLRCYISRVENGHTVPSVETLEKMAHALEIPMYALFYDGEKPPKVPKKLARHAGTENVWGGGGKDARVLGKFRRLLGRISPQNRRVLLLVTQKIARTRANESASKGAARPE